MRRTDWPRRCCWSRLKPIGSSTGSMRFTCCLSTCRDRPTTLIPKLHTLFPQSSRNASMPLPPAPMKSYSGERALRLVNSYTSKMRLKRSCWRPNATTVLSLSISAAARKIRIKDLALLTARLTGYEGEIVWDAAQLHGQPRRALDVTRAERYFDFRARIPLEEGLRRTIDWYTSHQSCASPF